MHVQRGLRVRKIRPYADHVRIKALQKSQVMNQIRKGLERGTYHESGTNLVSDRFQVLKTLSAPGSGHGCRVETVV